MADYSNKIEADSSFFAGVDGASYLKSEIAFNDPSLIGYKNVIDSVQFAPPSPASVNKLLDFRAVYSSDSFIDVLSNFQASASNSTTNRVYVQYNSVSGTINSITDNEVSYKTAFIFAPVFIELSTIYTAGREFILYKDILSSWYLLESKIITNDTVTNYTNYTGYNDFYANPLPTWEMPLDYEADYTNTSGVEIGLDRLVEIFFAGWVNYNTIADLFCSLLSIPHFNLDVTLDYGIKSGVLSDVIMSLPIVAPMYGDLYASYLDIIGTITDTTLISGSKYGLQCDSIVSLLSTDSTIGSDVNIFPIYFDNFSVDIYNFVASGTLIYVDAHDPINGLTVSGTYFKVNDIEASTQLVPIVDGFRLCLDNYNVIGPIKITAHAENNVGDSLEQDFYLTSGYIVTFDNKKKIGFNYGFNSVTSVRIEAENSGSCPSITKYGYWFVSEEHKYRNLTAEIVCDGATNHGSIDMAASIYPHSTAFFYDKEFRVVLTAKDFSGNEMDPFILEFKIRNDG